MGSQKKAGNRGRGRGDNDRVGAAKVVEEVPQPKTKGDNRNENGIGESNSGLQYVDVQPGSGPLPAYGQSVFVKYRGMIDGTMKVFDQGKTSFHSGRGEVIAGLDEGVQSMRAGGVRKLRIPPHLGYGSSGAGNGTIPRNATLIFDVAVVRIGSRKQVAEEAEDAEWARKGGGKGIEGGRSRSFNTMSASEECKEGKKRALQKFRADRADVDEGEPVHKSPHNKSSGGRDTKHRKLSMKAKPGAAGPGGIGTKPKHRIQKSPDVSVGTQELEGSCQRKRKNA